VTEKKIIASIGEAACRKKATGKGSYDQKKEQTKTGRNAWNIKRRGAVKGRFETKRRKNLLRGSKGRTGEGNSKQRTTKKKTPSSNPKKKNKKKKPSKQKKKKKTTPPKKKKKKKKKTKKKKTPKKKKRNKGDAHERPCWNRRGGKEKVCRIAKRGGERYFLTTKRGKERTPLKKDVYRTAPERARCRRGRTTEGKYPRRKKRFLAPKWGPPGEKKKKHAEPGKRWGGHRALL